MRPAGRFVADVLTALVERADVGVNLLELDELAHRMITERGAESCYIDYHPSFGASPFGKVLCTSVNDAVLHGLPHDYALAAGIGAARAGGRVGDISFAIAQVARNAGYKINTDFGGHGVGRTMHGDPHIA